MDYGLWLLVNDTGQITLTGWSETGGDDTTTRTDHWPTYQLCEDRAQLPDKLHELGLDLAPGADLSDLDKHWDVYVWHSDVTALRAILDEHRACQ